MNRIIKVVYLTFSLFIVHYSLFPAPIDAVCPVCTVAVGAGLGLSRYLGIDDAVSSIWIGGLLMSVSFWTVDWLKKKKFKMFTKFKNDQLVMFSIIFWYVFTLFPLWFGGLIGHPFNTILGIDKIIFGTAVGSVVFIFGMWADKKVRKIKGKQYFAYQKVVFPVVSLVITSLVVYYYGGYLY